MDIFSSKEHYLQYLEQISQVPDGFRIATLGIRFYPEEKPVLSPLPMNLVLIQGEQPIEAFGGLFTRNKFPGAPVLIGRKRMEQPKVRGVLINNKVSNVGAPSGVEDAEEILSTLATYAGGKAEEYIPASTGIIGWRLPKREILNALPELVQRLGTATCFDAAKAIMTTDAYPKVARRRLGHGSLVGFAKGAGMIEPNLATMLVFLLTDVILDRKLLRETLHKVTEETFNCISVDSDQSTSDTLLCLSSGYRDTVSPAEWETALSGVCGELAEQIVRNGEGTSHVIRVRICGAPDFETARELGKAVVNSLLVKTAIYGNDPNVGRIVSALGDYIGNRNLPIDPARWEIFIGREQIFSKGKFLLDREKEGRLSAYLKEASMEAKGKTFPPHNRMVDIQVELGSGSSEAMVLGSDLSYEYIRENADYRS
ncbi:MAG: bifunctional ornithine acetyltransferase/N-acetylglutamate synthase [Spirochaetes bacterium]|nr:bifunctional ornithine acetyltransferase/N-acetylglutamate synthase [Spirochaetota bacterium]